MSRNHGKKDAIILQLISSKVTKYDLVEFKGLANSANYNIVDYIRQKRNKVDHNYFFGSGKVKIIKDKLVDIRLEKHASDYRQKLEKTYEEDLVILVNNRLRPRQILNLSQAFQTKVIDRDLLILEIFEENATTHESRLQLKLARLALETSRKKEILSQKLRSERQGRDFQGKGFPTVEAYERAYKERHSAIIEELLQVRKNRANQRKSRKNEFNIAIVGYTNAGKTTFMNTLKDTEFKTKNTAFTTVSTRTRRIEIDGEVIIFTDTVGFVHDIPHEIIEAFLSTLEEISFSNCIILLSDISDSLEMIERKIRTTFSVLSKIGGLMVPIIYIFNKIDLIENTELNEKKKNIKNILPANAYIYYMCAKDKDSVYKLTGLLKLFKLGKLILHSNEKYINNLLNTEDLKYKRRIPKTIK
ncbi:MAG: GTPase HflX [Candidatus Lokiarchaeota archaeon]|nr:GTPase HflX [Candidatus Lokiarchaeota archaeon]